MNRLTRISLAFVIQILLGGVIFSLASASSSSKWSASSSGASIPPGFKLLESTTGVQLYVKGYAQGSPDYVQVVDLSQGAAVVPLLGDVRERRPGLGAFGGADPRIQSQTLGQFWRQLRQKSQTAFCVTNGQFFFMPESPTRLPFPLKMDGEIVSTGYARAEFAGQRLMLEIWGDQAQITPMTKESLYASSAPAIIGGLTEDANKSAKHFTGRTFVGVLDSNNDGAFETILIFNTRSTRQVDAAAVLRDFGAAQVMMLDGGGSTQLSCKGEDYIPSDRLIPQALGVMGGPKQTIPGYVQRAEAPAPVLSGTSAPLLSKASAQASSGTGATQAGVLPAGGEASQSNAVSSQADTQGIPTPARGAKGETSRAGSTNGGAGSKNTGAGSTNLPPTSTAGLADILWVPVVMMLISALMIPTFLTRQRRYM